MQRPPDSPILDDATMAPAPSTARTRLWWAWYGPRAAGTAAHFARHVQELFAREGIDGVVGVESAGVGAAKAWCTVPSESEAAVVRALRPHGVEPLPVDVGSEP